MRDLQFIVALLRSWEAARSGLGPDQCGAVADALDGLGTDAEQVEAAERDAVVAYVRDRARWLRAEIEHGGDTSLLNEAKALDYLAVQIGHGRRAGSHPR